MGMLFSTDYESLKLAKEDDEINFDKFMDDIVMREGSERKDDCSEQVLQEAKEAELLRQRRGAEYTDRACNKIVWRKK